MPEEAVRAALAGWRAIRYSSITMKAAMTGVMAVGRSLGALRDLYVEPWAQLDEIFSVSMRCTNITERHSLRLYSQVFLSIRCIAHYLSFFACFD